METMEFGTVSMTQLVLMLVTAILGITLPLITAIIWCRKKHEPFTTVLIGAATFLLFAIVIEKPLQSLLIMPDSLGLPQHAASNFINANPILWSFVVGLFPGVFEETGRFVAFKTVLRKRKQSKTGITHGLGHGGFEAMFVLGITFIEYFVFGIMINQGTFYEQMIASVKDTLTPDMMKQITAIIEAITTFSAGTAVLSLVERVIAVLYHTGASILVFYACKDKKKFWLYPLSIVIHTVIDGFMGLQLAGVINVSSWILEVVFGVASLATFLGAYLLLYRKDKRAEQPA